MAAELLNGLGRMAPQMVLATPINDTQVLALMAAGMDSLTPADAVARAAKIMEEACLESPKLAKRLRERKSV